MKLLAQAEKHMLLKWIQNGQLRATFENRAPASSALRETCTCSQILNELPWVIGIVFSFKASQQTSQSSIPVA